MADDILARLELFAALTPEERASIGTRLQRRRYPKGAPLFFRGDAGASLYVVERGWVKLVLASPDGKEQVLDFLGPGEAFGELALLDQEPRSADAVA